MMIKEKVISGLAGCLLAGVALAQSPVTLTVNTESPGAAIPPDFLGLSFEEGNLQPNGVGVNGYTNALTAAQVRGIYLSASTPLPETLTFINTGPGQLQLNWAYGTLQSATNVTGPYNDVPYALPPYTVPTTNSQQFYRVRED